jgi:cell division protein FtsB
MERGSRPVPFRRLTLGPAHVVFAVALLLLSLFAYAALQTAADTYRLRQDERRLVAEVQALRDQRAELHGLLTYLQSDEYVEAFARQQFGLVRPGEVLVEVEAPPAQKPQRSPGQRWWEALFGQPSGD